MSAVLHVGNIVFEKKRHGGHHDACQVTNPDTIALISRLLMVRTHSHFSYLLNYISLNERLTICQVKETTLVDALTKKKAQAGGETINMPLTLANVSTIHHTSKQTPVFSCEAHWCSCSAFHVVAGGNNSWRHRQMLVLSPLRVDCVAS